MCIRRSHTLIYDIDPLLPFRRDLARKDRCCCLKVIFLDVSDYTSDLSLVKRVQMIFQILHDSWLVLHDKIMGRFVN